MTKHLGGAELLATRLKLAERAMDQENYTVALELLDKILEDEPPHKEAITLKEKAVSLLETSQKESQKTVKKEIRFKEILDQATALMAQKDYQGALFHVQQVLDVQPDHADAYRMSQEIQNAMASLENKAEQERISDQENLARSEDLWKQGKEAFVAKNYTQAWRLLEGATKLLQERNLQPPFRIDLKELMDQAKKELSLQADPLINQARNFRDLGDKANDQKKPEYYNQALTQYYEVQKIYEEYPLLSEEIDLVIHKLDKSVEPFFVEAQTLKDLEGCCPSHPYFQKVMSLAKYEAVPYYQQAKAIMEQCPCR